MLITDALIIHTSFHYYGRVSYFYEVIHIWWLFTLQQIGRKILEGGMLHVFHNFLTLLSLFFKSYFIIWTFQKNFYFIFTNNFLYKHICTSRVKWSVRGEHIVSKHSAIILYFDISSEELLLGWLFSSKINSLD
jgi:hypothetical protein